MVQHDRSSLCFWTSFAIFLTFGVASPTGNSAERELADAKRESEYTRITVYDNYREIEILGKKYLRADVNKLKSWEKAKAKCEEKNGILASNLSPEWFKEAAKFQEGYDGINGLGHYSGYWVGAQLQGTNLKNDWKWITGESLPLSHPNWQKGIPHFNLPGAKQYCVFAIIERDNNDKLTDRMTMANNYCNLTAPFIGQLND